MDTYEAKVTRCESILEYIFTDKLRCLAALQASGHLLFWQNASVQIPKNDKLAVFGDVIAKAHLCERWYATGGSKGQWTAIEQQLLSNRNFERVGRNKNLDSCVILNAGTPNVSSNTMATTVEAILGAVYLDGGIAALANVLAVLGINHALLEVTRRNGTTGGLREFLHFGL